jgi:hypothetical protein
MTSQPRRQDHQIHPRYPALKAEPELEATTMTTQHQPAQQDTPTSSSNPDRDDRDRIYAATRAAVHRTISQVAHLHANAITEPAGTVLPATGIEPLAGLKAAEEIERIAGTAAFEHTRDARAAGHSWHEIGSALGMLEGFMTGNIDEPLADTAYIYATGRAPGPPRTYDLPFTWQCRTCEQTVADNGVIYGPAHDEKGHASTCARHAHAIATWNAQWQPTGPTIQTAEGDHDADWEAGQ